MTSSPDISAVVVNWNTRDLLVKCLDSLLASPGVALEVIVVDNASNDGSAETVGRRFPGVKLLANNENVGFSRAVNQGIRESEGSYIMVLNADVEIVGNALATLTQFMESRPEAGVAAPMQLTPDKHKLMRSWFPDPGIRPMISQVLLIDWIRSRRLVRLPSPAPFEVDWLMGAALFIRRGAAEALNGFDESGFMYYEDWDFCYRMRSLGRSVMLVPEAVVRHHENASGSQAFAHNRLSVSNTALRRLYRKHFGAARAAILSMLLALDSLTKVPLLYAASRVSRKEDSYARFQLREHLAALGAGRSAARNDSPREALRRSESE